MRRIVLLCTANRMAAQAAPAYEMYKSQLFHYGWIFAQQFQPDRCYLLSAHYGLLPAEREIGPYPETLSSLTGKSLREWANTVLEQLQEREHLAETEVIFLGLKRFYRLFVPHLPHCQVPLEGLSMAEALHWTRQQVLRGEA